MSEYEQMVADCIERESRLSDWERKFVDEMERILRTGGSLTPSQGEKLEEIWDAATANG